MWTKKKKEDFQHTQEKESFDQQQYILVKIISSVQRISREHKLLYKKKKKTKWYHL